MLESVCHRSWQNNIGLPSRTVASEFESELFFTKTRELVGFIIFPIVGIVYNFQKSHLHSEFVQLNCWEFLILIMFQY